MQPNMRRSKNNAASRRPNIQAQSSPPRPTIEMNAAGGASSWDIPVGTASDPKKVLFPLRQRQSFNTRLTPGGGKRSQIERKAADRSLSTSE